MMFKDLANTFARAVLVPAAIALISVPLAAVSQEADVSDASEMSSAETEVFGASGVPDTLMFTIDELNEIQSRIAGGDVTDEVLRTEAIEQANLFLSSILYFGPKDWTIWVNGTPIGPQQAVDSFEVVSIDPTSVEMIIPLSAAGMRPVRLEPNQTFISQTGVVLEGQWD